MTQPLMQPVLKYLGFSRGPEPGSYTTLFAAASQYFTRKQSGLYFVPVAQEGKPGRNAVDEEMGEKLWAWTESELRRGGWIE